MTVLSIASVGPHDFELSLRIAMSFSPDPLQDFSVLRFAVRIGETPAVLELRQVRRDPAALEVRINHPDKDCWSLSRSRTTFIAARNDEKIVTL